MERFAIDADATAVADSDAPVCRSNAPVEAHFRGVKHGRLQKRRRVRPREFLSAELKYVIGKVKEKKLPKVRITKKDTAGMEEKWRPRKRTPRYTDPARASRLLAEASRRCRSSRRTTPSSAQVSTSADLPSAGKYNITVVARQNASHDCR